MALYNGREDPSGLLPYVHIMLVYLKCLHILRSRLFFDDNAAEALDDLLSPDRLKWLAFASFLNHIAKFFPLSSRTESFASSETSPNDGVPLLEGYLIRGLGWA